MIRILFSIAIFILWLLFYGRAWKYRQIYIEDPELHPRSRTDLLLSSWDFLGLYWMKRLGWTIESASNQKKWHQLCRIVGRKEAMTALKQQTRNLYRDIFLLCGVGTVLLFQSLGAGMLGMSLVFLRILFDCRSRKNAERQQTNRFLTDLPDVLTNLLLTLEAGLVLDQAWEVVERMGRGPLYEEMGRVRRLRESGFGYVQSYRNFGKEPDMDVLRELGSFLATNVEKGGGDLVENIDRLRREIFVQRSRAYRRQTQWAAQQMLFPALLLFIGILLLVLLPLLGRAQV